jgi:radical SAM protein with 4Fe4S-binding SPASM domain
MRQDTLTFYKYKPVDKPVYKGKFCKIPFDTLQIDEDGDVQLCDCQHFMPYTIGNIYQDTLENIWLSEAANRVRQSIINEDFTYCSWSCSHLATLPQTPAVLPVIRDLPKNIKLDMDRSCNLKCPSCREDIIIEKNSTKINKQIELFEQVKQWGLANPKKHIVLAPTSSGEIFASSSGLQFLKSLIDYPYNNLKIHITTNGTLIYRNRELLNSVIHLIDSFSISIDASTSETYAQVRGGDWNELLLGLDFVKNNFKKPALFRFCIQKNNYHEIESFAEFAEQFTTTINYQQLKDWGHWTIAWWKDNNVMDRTTDTFELTLDSIERAQLNFSGHTSVSSEISNYLKKRKDSP